MAVKRAGFTLIELLIVVVIIGILGDDRDSEISEHEGQGPASTAIKSDLRNLATAEEAYMFDNGSYTGVIASLSYRYVARRRFSPSRTRQRQAGRRVNAPAVVSAHMRDCIIGNVPAQAPATVEGLIGCQ